MAKLTERVAEQVAEAHVYTMRELNQNTAQVIDAINDSKQPAVVTKHGRFVALIQPLAGVSVETVVLTDGRLARVLVNRAEQDDAVTWTSDEVAQRIRSHFDAD